MHLQRFQCCPPPLSPPPGAQILADGTQSAWVAHQVAAVNSARANASDGPLPPLPSTFTPVQWTEALLDDDVAYWAAMLRHATMRQHRPQRRLQSGTPASTASSTLKTEGTRLLIVPHGSAPPTTAQLREHGIDRIVEANGGHGSPWHAVVTGLSAWHTYTGTATCLLAPATDTTALLPTTASPRSQAVIPRGGAGGEGDAARRLASSDPQAPVAIRASARSVTVRIRAVDAPGGTPPIIGYVIVAADRNCTAYVQPLVVARESGDYQDVEVYGSPANVTLRFRYAPVTALGMGPLSPPSAPVTVPLHRQSAGNGTYVTVGFITPSGRIDATAPRRNGTNTTDTCWGSVEFPFLQTGFDVRSYDAAGGDEADIAAGIINLHATASVVSAGWYTWFRNTQGTGAFGVVPPVRAIDVMSRSGIGAGALDGRLDLLAYPDSNSFTMQRWGPLLRRYPTVLRGRPLAAALTPWLDAFNATRPLEVLDPILDVVAPPHVDMLWLPGLGGLTAYSNARNSRVVVLAQALRATGTGPNATAACNMSSDGRYIPSSPACRIAALAQHAREVHGRNATHSGNHTSDDWPMEAAAAVAAGPASTAAYIRAVAQRYASLLAGGGGGGGRRMQDSSHQVSTEMRRNKSRLEIDSPISAHAAQTHVELRGAAGNAATVQVCTTSTKPHPPSTCTSGWLSTWSHPIPPATPVTAPLVIARPLHAAPEPEGSHNVAAWRGAVVVVQRGRLPLCELVSRVAEAGAVGVVILDRVGGVCASAGFTQACVPGGVGGAAAGIGWGGADPYDLWRSTAGMPAVLIAASAVPDEWR